MGTGQHLCTSAPVHGLQPLPRGLGWILGAAGVVQEELRYGPLRTPDAASVTPGFEPGVELPESG